METSSRKDSPLLINENGSKPKKLIVEKKKKEGLITKLKKWNLTDYDLSKTKDRIRFFINCIIVGFLFFFVGDIFLHITFKAVGVISFVIGGLILMMSWIVPLWSTMMDDY